MAHRGKATNATAQLHRIGDNSLDGDGNLTAASISLKHPRAIECEQDISAALWTTKDCDNKCKGIQISADEFLFYHPLSEVDTELKKLGTKNYHLIDCNNIDISEDVKFDLITSWVSCGFHYPVNTYRDLILKHSHAGTRVVMDLRVMYKKTNMPEREDGVEILKVIAQRKKFIMAELKLS
jgi:hypothetical protein